MDANNVSFGKPKATGCVFVAAYGTELPTDGTSALNAGFANMGYISEDGYVDSIETETASVKDWGGKEVLSSQGSFKETHTVNFLEANEDVLKAYYGAENVTKDGNNFTVKEKGAELPTVSVVIETVLTGGRVRRIVIPMAKLTDRSGDRTYKSDEAIVYPAKFSASPDASGTYHYEYTATTSVTG